MGKIEAKSGANLRAWLGNQAKSRIKNPIFHNEELQIEELLIMNLVTDETTIGDFMVINNDKNVEWR
ncbi:unnamed protein product [Caenorhabditis brenneri]